MADRIATLIIGSIIGAGAMYLMCLFVFRCKNKIVRIDYSFKCNRNNDTPLEVLHAQEFCLKDGNTLALDYTPCTDLRVEVLDFSREQFASFVIQCP